MPETAQILAWTLVTEIPIPQDIYPVLVNGEVPVAAYKTFRDSATFTNKRLIVRDAQGISGKKVEIYSLPYSSILMWSSENGAGMLNFNSELELWTKAGHIKVNLSKGLDIRRLDRLISEAILGDGDASPIASAPAAPTQAKPAPAPAVAPAQVPPPVVEPSVEAGWHPDPKGLHELRYHDGSDWTNHVCDAGAQSTD